MKTKLFCTQDKFTNKAYNEAVKTGENQVDLEYQEKESTRII